MATDEEGWIVFREALERAIGVPLAQYKAPQMIRRLGALMKKYGIEDWEQFAAALKSNPEVLEKVRDTMTINVSEFFRQPDRFEDLRRVHLPALLKERPRLKLWSAGCSIGCEPYTLAMILDQVDPQGRHSVIATDVDFGALAKAREASYTAADVRGVPPAVLKKYFTVEGDTYHVVPEIKKRITFRRHDLLKDDYPRDLDLILCRNVVIYFTEEAKTYIHDGFANALRPGGLLFVGGSEMISKPQQIGLETRATSFYRRAA